MKQTLDDIIDQYIEQIAKVKGDYSIEDIRRAFETGFQAGQIVAILDELEEAGPNDVN